MKTATLVFLASLLPLSAGAAPATAAPTLDPTGVQDLGVDISSAGTKATDREKFVRSLSADQQAALRKSCSVIVAQPSSHANQVVAFCNDVNNMPSAAEAAPPAGSLTVTLPDDAVLTYNLIGSEVYNTTHDDVGKIKDILIEKDRIIGYVVSVGGFLGMGERYAVVEAAALSLAYDATSEKWIATINATNDQLKSAPEFKYQGRFKR